MGQYFIAVNTTKDEYFTAWEIDGGAKLWEWCANHQAGIFPYLLRRSDDTGGGDIRDPDYLIYAGRWAGDQVYLVGDYDSSGLYERAKAEYHNIAGPLVEEYNRFMDYEPRRLRYRPRT